MNYLPIKPSDKVLCTCWKDGYAECFVAEVRVVISMRECIIYWPFVGGEWVISTASDFKQQPGSWYGNAEKIVSSASNNTTTTTTTVAVTTVAAIDNDFFADRKAEAMKGIDPATGETIAAQKRGGGLMFL